MERLTWHLISREYVGLKKALDLVAHPRDGTVDRPFQPSTSGSDTGKRIFRHASPPHAEPAGNFSRQKYPKNLPPLLRSSILTAIKSQLPANSNTDEYLYHFEKRIAQSLTSSSWSRYETALKSFQNFLSSENSTLTWPISKDEVVKYVAWADSHCHLAACSIKTYLSNLSQIQKLLGFNTDGIFNSKWIKSYLRGMENAKIYDVPDGPTRRPITFQILQLIGHQIFDSNWVFSSKQTVWAACCLAFWGSFRLKEILPPSKTFFEPQTDLLWTDIHFCEQTSMIVHVKSPKTSGFPGHFIDLFSVPDTAYCPVKQLQILKENQIQNKIFCPDRPVFSLTDQVFLTTKSLIQSINAFLKPLHLLNQSDSISGHSFRQGIPSLLASSPGSLSKLELQLWGRWDSSAFKSYLKLKKDQKHDIFKKIVSQIFSK
jgi:hypothetical protein